MGVTWRSAVFGSMVSLIIKSEESIIVNLNRSCSALEVNLACNFSNCTECKMRLLLWDYVWWARSLFRCSIKLYGNKRFFPINHLSVVACNLCWFRKASLKPDHFDSKWLANSCRHQTLDATHDFVKTPSQGTPRHEQFLLLKILTMSLRCAALWTQSFYSRFKFDVHWIVSFKTGRDVFRLPCTGELCIYEWSPRDDHPILLTTHVQVKAP